MNRTKRALGTLIVVLTCTLGLATGARAETQASPSVLPFDPIALEFVLPGNTVGNNIFNVRGLSTQTKPIGNLTYSWAGQTKTVNQYLAESSTDSFLVLDDGKIAYERYYDINTPISKHQSWSMAKSFLSTLIGIAISEGKITSIDDPVTKYVPSLAVNGFNGVSIRHVLQMRSGVRYREADVTAGTMTVIEFVANTVSDNLSGGLLGGTYREQVHSPRLDREHAPGSYFEYSSVNSQVLGMVLMAATGKPYHQYLQDKIWKPAGMGSSAWLLSDRTGMGSSFANIYATLRDFGRFGLLWMDGGKRGSNQIVPPSWVTASKTPTSSDYGLHWWLPANNRGDFMALGLANQTIYVSPNDRTVIVKLSDDLVTLGDRQPEMERVYQRIADYVRVN